MTDALTLDNAATSFGSFKPTGHVMIGLPDATSQAALRRELIAAGWLPEQVGDFTPSETVEQMQELLDSPSPLAGFGAEAPLMRRYLEASRQGGQWLLVKAKGSETLERLAGMAKRHNAGMAVSYGSLLIEELI